jgi:hypothetical protein
MPAPTQGGPGGFQPGQQAQEPNGIVWETLTPDKACLSAVCGESQSMGAGVYGINDQAGIGVNGQSQTGTGVRGVNMANRAIGLLGGEDPIFHQHAGVYGSSDQQGVIGMAGGGGTGVYGGNTSGAGVGVRGETTTGTAVQGQSFGAGFAGRFYGNVEVNGGDITLTGKDCAEDFEMLGAEEIGPGTVVVIDSGGAFKRSHKAYDKRVAGVVSGAGECRPGIILGREQPQENKLPVALVGRVYCEVDAGYSPIEVGDLLTTSPTPGHAMKATEPLKAFGAVIGKALRPLDSGRGLIPILVALQ